MASEPPLRAAARRGLPDEAADLIREAILHGRLAPGAPLRETELAAQLSVSRGSVREGLGALEEEGLVVRGWHRGTRVIEVTRADVLDLYAVRGALDRVAAASARERADPSALRALYAVVDEMETALRRDAGGTELVALDMRFHDGVYTAAANPRLYRAWLGVRSQVHLFQLQRAAGDDVDYRGRLVREHRGFVDLLRNGSTDAVDRMAADHVASARDALLHDPADVGR